MARSSKKRRRQAFTLIEVMVSLAVMTIGAMAMLALQAHTIRSNAHARQLSTALEIAQRWVERFKQDAQRWNVAGAFNDPAKPSDVVVLANTTFLKQITTAAGVFQTINNTTATVSNAFDYQGNDVLNNVNDPAAPIFYCASFRPAWVYFGRAMRVDVRVWWARASAGDNQAGAHVITNDFASCNEDNARLNPGGTLIDDYHVVYLSSVIRMTPVYN